MPENSPRRKLVDRHWIRPAIPLTPGSRRGLQRHVLSSPECEVCGFIYENEYIPLTNIATDSRTFIADPTEVAVALARYGEPPAIFHSHPNGSLDPSAKDLELASYYNASIIVIGAVINGRLEWSQVVTPPQLEPEPAVQP